MGVVDAGDGWYSTDAGTFPTGISSVRWNSSGQPQIIAREYFGSVVDNNAIAAAAVWQVLTSTFTTAGSVGKLVADDIDAKISTRLPTASYVVAPTAAQNAAAVRDVNNASPAGGSLGADIKAGVAGDPWTTILPGGYAANSAGSLIGNNLDAKVSTRLPTATYVAPPTAVQNATATRDIDNTNPAANSLGAMVKSAGTAGDPWSTALPGAYGAGTAGKIIGTNIDALISSRLAAATYVVPPTAAQNAVAVRDVSNASPVAGSLGADVKNGSADPWAVAVPASYGTGTAGNLLGNNLDVKVSTRLADANYSAPIPAATIAAAVRDVNNQTPAANSLGAAVNAGASAGDPWSTLIPGSYNPGTAGKILGTFVDVAVSTRMAASSFVTPPTKEVIAVAVRDVDNASPAAGSMGEAINRAASAGDPWSTQLPGSYVAGSAGKLMSDNLDAKVSSRLAASGYTTPPATFDIANAVRDVDNRTPAPNSLGAAVNSAASAGDPWSTVLPGTYGANTAGSIIGTKVDVAVSSRLAANRYTAPASLLATAQAVRDVDNTNPAANSLGAAVNRSASAGDPWSAQIPNAIYGAGTAGKLIGDTLNATVASRLAASAYVIPPNVDQIAEATRDVDNTSPVSGSMGDAINRAASAGDPWGTVLPGTYAPGTAGDMIGNYVDAKISSRLPASSYVQAPSAQVVAQSVRDIDNTAPAVNSLARRSMCLRLRVIRGSRSCREAMLREVLANSLETTSTPRSRPVRPTQGRTRRARQRSLRGCRDRSL